MPARTRHAKSSAATEPPPPAAAAAASSSEPASSSHQQSQQSQSQQQSGQSTTAHRLKFNQPLSWRAGKAIQVSDLLSRLQTLAHELRKLDQEEIDRESLRKVSQDLGGGHLLAHRDKGVRAWTACCVVDVLRLCAPDAPFTEGQLKDIFTAIITSIIPMLADPANGYNQQHIYVLSSLAEVKSIVLLTDLEAADSLILPLFTSCFDIVSGSSKSSTGEELAKNVEYDMTRLLVTVIDEAASLAPEVVDIIVAQFLRVDPRIMERTTSKGKKNESAVDSRQDTLLLKDYPPAYNMAKAICSACTGKMTSYISQYFNNVIIDASAPGGVNGASKGSAHRRASLNESDDEGEDIKELSKAHRLIRELWRACPDVLQNVVPQLEAELSAESVSLRLLATQAIGDIAAGIGIAGPPPPAPMEPSTYPPVTLANYAQTIPQPNILVTPLSPKPFSQAHSAAYESFLGRRQDKSVSVRAAWATAIGRILLTSAGGGGLSSSEEQGLITSLATMLRDVDEKVRMAAVDVMGLFGFHDIITKFGSKGGISDAESILAILAERVKDKKHSVRERAMKILARIWAVASGEIEENNEEVISAIGDAPSRIFDAYYTNDLDIHVLIDHVLFEVLLPLNYPPIKSKSSKSSSSQTRKSKIGSQSGEGDIDVDKIRVRRILTLLRGLDDKAKKVFFSLQVRQLNMKGLVSLFLTTCEQYNGGVMDKDEDNVKAQLTRVVDNMAKTLPEPSRVSADLWKFAKTHDRRNYQLVRFSMSLVSDYRTVTKAIRELSKRIQSSSGAASASLLETLTPLLYRCSSLVFNRSHIPPIMELSRTDEQGLANSAHEMLREISSRNPEVLEAHVQEMCKDLEAQAPTATKKDDPGAEEILKACAGFAKKLPSKLPKDRKFLLALTNYALYSSSPRAAKHAVSIVMAGATKKEMYAKDLIQKTVKNYSYGSNHFLTKLATISQLYLLAPKEADAESDDIISIAINQTLLNNRSPEPDAGYSWSDAVDEETSAKEWALKIIVNSLRSKENSGDGEEFKAHAEPIYGILNTLVSSEGELSKAKDTPAAQKSRLRLLASKLILKLCSSRSICDRLFVNKDFNSLALVAQDQLLNVRAGFIGQLKKRLTQNSYLGYRWYTIPFLLAFEPSSTLKDGTLTWLRSRASFFSRQSQVSGKSSENNTTMESVFARLLSLLAHHPDYPTTSSPDEEIDINDLVDFSRYILFYLSAVANENNLSLIFHVAQRVKQARDAVSKSDTITTHLHTLSDLAQASIRRFAEFYSQQHKIGGSGGSGAANILQTYPGKMRLPSSLFASMTSHQEAQDAAEKNYLPEEVEDTLDRTVRAFMKPKAITPAQALAKKRKLEEKAAREIDRTTSSKKAKKEKGKAKVKALPIRGSDASGGTKDKKPSKRKSKGRKNDDDWEEGGKWGGDQDAGSSSRRKSVRDSGVKKGVSYVEGDSDEDDMQMEEWDQRVEEDEEGSEEESEEEESGEESDKEEAEAEVENGAEASKEPSEEAEETSQVDQDGDVSMGNAAEEQQEEPAEEQEEEEEEEPTEKAPSPSPPRKGRGRPKRVAATTTKAEPATTKSKAKPKPETKPKQNPEPKGKPKTESKAEPAGTRRSTRRAAAG